MLRVPVHKIAPGMVLARPIPFPDKRYRYLLQRNVEIPIEAVPRLKKLGVREVWVHYPGLEFLQTVLDEELEERQREVYYQVQRNFEQMMQGSSIELDLPSFERSIKDLFYYLMQHHCGSLLLQKLDAYDDYLLVHSTNVCYLGLLLGNRLEEYLVAERRFKSYHEAKDLQLLGLGMLLHDIGKTKLPREILDKPGPLTREELELVRSHTILGYNMVRGRLPPSAAQIVLNHHQRYDGRGYPRLVNRATGNPLPPMQGRQIPIFSRIATVVDVYDAATTQRVYSPRKLPVRALHEMRTICRGFFDPEIERAFYEIVPPFPIGQAVTLSDGSEAVVVDFNPRRPTRPKVQILSDPYGGRVADPSRHEIDLALHDHLHVARVDGEDVTPYLSVPEESVPLAT